MTGDDDRSGGADDTAETINREQQDQGQAHAVADEARRTGQGRPDSVRGGAANPAQILPDDVPDLVETMNAMVRSGQIDNGAFEGEPDHDDEEGLLGDTESGGDDPLEGLTELPGPDGAAVSSYYGMPEAGRGSGADGDETSFGEQRSVDGGFDRRDGSETLFNELADGSEDPLADPVALEQVADDGDDPLGKVASEHGLEDEGPEDDDEDYDDADDDDLLDEEDEDDGADEDAVEQR